MVEKVCACEVCVMNAPLFATKKTCPRHSTSLLPSRATHYSPKNRLQNIYTNIQVTPRSGSPGTFHPRCGYPEGGLGLRPAEGAPSSNYQLDGRLIALKSGTYSPFNINIIYNTISNWFEIGFQTAICNFLFKEGYPWFQSGLGVSFRTYSKL